jgi:hypothetical protein
VLLGALWACAAALATGVGLVAVDHVAGQVGDQISSPLDDKSVQQALAAVTPGPTPTQASPGPRPRSTTPAVATGALRTVHTRGGVVGARCEEDRSQLVYASPAQGWRTERSRDTVVRFVSSRQAVTVRLSCVGEDLRSSTRTDDLSPPSSPSPGPEPSSHESDSPQPSPSESSGGDDHEAER